jgi:hypothetical protein
MERMDRPRLIAGVAWVALGIVAMAAWTLTGPANPAGVITWVAAIVISIGTLARIAPGSLRWWGGRVAGVMVGVELVGAVVDRFGLFGPPGSPAVSWGDWSHFQGRGGPARSVGPTRRPGRGRRDGCRACARRPVDRGSMAPLGGQGDRRALRGLPDRHDPGDGRHVDPGVRRAGADRRRAGVLRARRPAQGSPGTGRRPRDGAGGRPQVRLDPGLATREEHRTRGARVEIEEQLAGHREPGIPQPGTHPVGTAAVDVDLHRVTAVALRLQP